MRVITVGLSAICIILGMNNIFNVKASKDVEQAIKETRPTVEEKAVNNYNTINNYNETNNYYENNIDEEKIQELEDKVTKLEKSKNEEENQEVLIEVDNYNVVKPTRVQIGDPWKGPKSYKCDRIAGYPAVCEYCGEIGEIHFNIKEWQDEQGTYHVTHVGCKDKCLNQYRINY